MRDFWEGDTRPGQFSRWSYGNEGMTKDEAMRHINMVSTARRIVVALEEAARAVREFDQQVREMSK